MRFLILFLISISAYAQTPNPVIRTNTPISGVWLAWDHGNPRLYNLTNLTTGQYYLGIPESSVLVAGVYGATNRFVVANSAGMSNTLIATNSWQTWTSSIAVYSYIVTLPVRTNVSCDIWTSTNLLTWRRIATIVSPTNSYQFLWTNDFGNRYFRSAISQ